MSANQELKPQFRVIFLAFLLTGVSCLPVQHADTVILNAKVITVDDMFSTAGALAVKDDKIMAVGSSREIKKMIGKNTRIIEAHGSTVIPGLIDAHLHPEQAAVSELHTEIPDMKTIGELLQWIKMQTGIRNHGDWIIFPKFFYTRLAELRPPTLQELDSVSPGNPVFLDGSYGAIVNSAAFRHSGILPGTNHPGIVRDKHSGIPTGMIKREAFRLFRTPLPVACSDDERLVALVDMMGLYNRYGITSVCAGAGDRNTYEMYKGLRESGKLTVRVLLNFRVSFEGGLTDDDWMKRISDMKLRTGDGDEWVKAGALKMILDGGILTGTAYMREPWGEKAATLFGFDDPEYRGVLSHTFEELYAVARAAALNGWKFTAHCTGGGGVDLLLDVYEAVNRLHVIQPNRFSIIHGNFFTPEAIERMAKLGVYADMQAAWFYKDADAMREILGEECILTFLPYRSLLDGRVMVNGGSDHMVKTDADASVNPYNPFLAMWSMITRTTERGSVIVPREAITREEALRIYTINNAYASFEEKLKGSIEPGKLADLAILSDDILTCPADEIKKIRSILTMVGGRIVYSE